MSNRDVHMVTSGLAGLGYSLYQSRAEQDGAKLTEALGGLSGGAIGGRMPDLLDPPTSPRHRGRAHSIAAAGICVQLCSSRLPEAQQWCRLRADEYARRRTIAAVGSWEEVTLAVAEFFFRWLAGATAGLLAGYMTHLALDAGTPCGINIF